MLTLAALATAFLERPGLSKSTICSYESTLIPLLQQYGRSPIDTLTRKQLEEYLNSLKHLSGNTHSRHQTIIQGLFNFAVKQNYLPTNPIARRKSSWKKSEHSPDRIVRYLNPQQLKLLYSLLEPASRSHTLVLLLHKTGVKIAEALAMNLEDIDKVNCKFHVTGQGNKKRWCLYGEDFAQVLETYLRLYRHPDHPAVFTAQQPFTKEVTRLSYSTAYKDWTNTVRKSPELKEFQLHDLRHTFAHERVELIGYINVSSKLH